MQSKATTVEQYLAELPADRREALQAIRKVILANLPQGVAEGMQYGMIGYDVPLRVIGQAIKRMSTKKFIERYESAVKTPAKRK